MKVTLFLEIITSVSGWLRFVTAYTKYRTESASSFPFRRNLAYPVMMNVVL